MWDRQHVAEPVPGVVEFVAAARDAGVTVFFLTNRPCEKYADEEDACPQKQTVIEGIRELGIPVEPEFVIAGARAPEWKGEKLVRRELIGRDYRVIMLIGDDFRISSPARANRSTHRAPSRQPVPAAAPMSEDTRISGATAGTSCPARCTDRGRPYAKMAYCLLSWRRKTRQSSKS